jgi:hypothetical protein
MKKLLTEWRKYLQEGRYEAATTELTRKVIPWVKFLITDILPKYIDKGPNKRDPNGLYVTTPQKYEKGKGLPKELEDKMFKAEFKFYIDPKILEETGDKFQVGGAFMSDPHSREDSFLQINTFLDPSFSEQDLNDYLATLKGITIHEIQHGGQEEEVFKTADPRYSNPLGGTQHNYNLIKGIRGYYSSEAEVDSYTKETYKKAKYYKKPFPEILDKRLQEFFDMFRRRRDKMNADDEKETPGEYRVQYSEKELQDYFFIELRNEMIDYAKKKYPEAQGI